MVNGVSGEIIDAETEQVVINDQELGKVVLAANNLEELPVVAVIIVEVTTCATKDYVLDAVTKTTEISMGMS